MMDSFLSTLAMHLFILLLLRGKNGGCRKEQLDVLNGCKQTAGENPAKKNPSLHAKQQ